MNLQIARLCSLRDFTTCETLQIGRLCTCSRFARRKHRRWAQSIGRLVILTIPIMERDSTATKHTADRRPRRAWDGTYYTRTFMGERFWLTAQLERLESEWTDWRPSDTDEEEPVRWYFTEPTEMQTAQALPGFPLDVRTRSAHPSAAPEHVTPKRNRVHSATERSMQCYEIDMLIMACLLPSPCARDNGIAAASRILNVRWRKMHRTILRHFLNMLVEASRNTNLHMTILDLEDVI